MKYMDTAYTPAKINACTAKLSQMPHTMRTELTGANRMKLFLPTSPRTTKPAVNGTSPHTSIRMVPTGMPRSLSAAKAVSASGNSQLIKLSANRAATASK